ncbi:MAG: M56 family metallopeptidase [Pedobacter terrae]
MYLRSSASFKYNVLLIFCLLFFGTCSLTFLWNYQYGSSWLIVLRPEVIASYSTLNLFIAKILSFTSTHAKFIFMLWLSCVGFCMVKMFVNFLYFNNLKHNRIIEPAKIWFEQVERLSRELGIKSIVHIKESAKVRVPIVLGHFKPVILFPLGLLSNIPAEQVEAILLHELAHIRRNDYLVNLFQNIAEALFFFNPGFLMLSGWLRSQREHCCDDIALSYTPNVKDYLLALVDFKGYVSKNNYRLAFTGNSILFNRVSRVLGKPYRKISSRDLSILSVSFFVLMGLGSLRFKNSIVWLSKQEKTSRTVVKQIQKSAIDLNFQIQAPLKKDDHPFKKRLVVAQTKHRSISEVEQVMLAQVPVDTKIDGLDKPSASTEHDLTPYEVDMEAYHKDLAQYNKDMLQYKSDLEAYNITIEKYNSKMKAYNKIHFPEKNNYPN